MSCREKPGPKRRREPGTWRTGTSVPTTRQASKTCVLEQMPTALWMAARQHHDAILRDLTHLLAEEGGPDFDLVGVDRARSSISVPLAAVAAAAGDDGSGSVLPQTDLEVTLPEGSHR